MNAKLSEAEILAVVQGKSSEVNSNTLSYSVREIRSMYEDGDIDIQPDFQRVYRWSQKQKSALIESMLLSIPLPSIFVSEQVDGRWDIVDGVQRVSTILSFMGLLKSNSELNEFALDDLEYLGELNGLSWSDLPQAVRRKIEHTRIDVTIVDSTSSADSKYNLFLRLNSGSVLSAQELRNCMLVMLNKSFFESMKQCSSFPNFVAIAQVSDRKKEESFLDELVLRFFMQSDFEGAAKSLRKDFGDELTEWSKRSSSSGNYMTDGKVSTFKRVISLAERAGTQDVLRRYDSESGKRRGPVSTAAFEFVMSGLVSNIDYWEKNEELLAEKLRRFWNYAGFTNEMGSGVNARDRFPVLVNNGREYFSTGNLD